MATKSISQLNATVAVDNGTLMEVATPDQNSASGYKSEKMSVAQLADHTATAVQYPGLTTTAKTLVSAINEAAQSGGGGGGSHTFSTTPQKVGTWTDGKDIWEQTYVFSVSDFHSPTIDTSTMKGQLWTDVPTTYDTIWIDYGNSFLMNTNHTTSNPKSHPLNYLAYGAGTFTRTNIQRTNTSNDGKPFVYFENTYTATEWYNIRYDLRWYIVIRWTEAAA